MIEPEKAVEIVKEYLDSNKITDVIVSERVRTQTIIIPHGAMKGKELTVHTVCYDYDHPYITSAVFITINAEDGTLLYGINSTRFFEFDE
ncbi:hypothetical protein [Flavobacterium beibuense]|uniref:PepSY domain-containing protein n=1 Tax=Flavobacterium beibuense F44-8 TaxID=1406840 RepID=A0A0A2LFY1_9FLAO|nr:hypothetical protein [Flavobacterium beibuense]KGO78779.1 hypothetical protein Q763_16765 [Flavobacterium beibuense F44-8]